MPGAPKIFSGTGRHAIAFPQSRPRYRATTLERQLRSFLRTTSFGIQYAYKVKLWGGQLSLGLQLGLISQIFDGTEVFIPESDYHQQTIDDAIPTSEVQGTAFDVGFGVYYTHKYFYAGLSVNPPIPTGNFVRRKLRRLDHPRILFHSRRQYSSEKCVI